MAEESPEQKKRPIQSQREWLKKNYGVASLGVGLALLALSVVFAVTLFVRATDQGEEISTEVALADGQKALVRKDKTTGVPTYLTGNVTPPPAKPKSAEAAVAFFEANKTLYNMSDPAKELTPKRSDTDNLGMTHVRMSQVYQGIPVYGAEMVVHFSNGNKIKTVNGNYTPGISIITQADVSAEAAAATAQSDLGTTAVIPAEMPPQLVIFPDTDQHQILAWRIQLSAEEPLARMIYFVDAHTGSIAAKIDSLRQ